MGRWLLWMIFIWKSIRGKSLGLSVFRVRVRVPWCAVLIIWRCRLPVRLSLRVWALPGRTISLHWRKSYSGFYPGDPIRRRRTLRISAGQGVRWEWFSSSLICWRRGMFYRMSAFPWNLLGRIEKKPRSGQKNC